MKHFDSWLVRARNVFPFLILFGILNLSACQSVAPHQVTATLPQPTATNKPPTPSWEIPAIPFPLSEKGPYQSKTLTGITFVDESRSGRKVAITIFFQPWMASRIPEERLTL